MNGGKKPKTNKIETQRRVEKIARMLSSGVRTFEIVQYSRENWDLSESRTNRLIRQAKDLIFAEIDGQDRREFCATLISTLQGVLAKSLRDGNLSCALGASHQLPKVWTESAVSKSREAMKLTIAWTSVFWA